MPALLPIVEAFLAKESLTYHKISPTHLTLKYSAPGRRVELAIRLHDKDEWVSITAYLPLCIPTDRVDAAARYVVAKNLEYRFTTLHLDAGDGELSVRAALAIEDGTLTHRQLGLLVGACKREVAAVLPDLGKIAYGEAPKGPDAKPEPAASSPAGNVSQGLEALAQRADAASGAKAAPSPEGVRP